MSKKLTSISEIQKQHSSNSLLNEEEQGKLNSYGVKTKKDTELEDISMPVCPMPENSLEDDLNDCDRYLEKKFGIKPQKGAGKQLWQIEKQKLKLQATLLWENKLKTMFQFSEMFKQLWNQLKEMGITIWNELTNTYYCVINYFKAEYYPLCRLWKQKKKATTKEEREKIKEKIKKQSKSYGGEVLEMLGILEFWNSLKDLWQILKNAWGTAKSGWKKLIDNFKELKSLLKDSEISIGKQICTWIVALLPILAQLALVTLAAVKLSKQKQKINEDIANDAISQIEKPLEEEIKSPLQKQAIENQKELNNKSGSIFDNNNNSVNNNETSKKNIKDSSFCSICPINLNDSDGIDNVEEKGYLLEIATDITNYSFVKKVNDKIKLEDTIGYINNKPIKSKIEGTVSEKNKTYLIVEPEEINENFDINVDTNNNKINEIIEVFNEVNKIETLLKDDLLYIYKCIFYRNFSGVKITESELDTKYINFINEHKKNEEKLQKDLQKISSKKYIEEKLKNDNGLILIKDEIIKMKNDFFNNIISTFIKYDKSYYSLNDCDYSLLGYYYNFLSNFNYDKDNKYKVEFFDLINTFVKDRLLIEKFNKEDLINKINTLSKEISSQPNFFNELKNINLQSVTSSIDGIEKIYESIKINCNLKKPEATNFEVDTKRLEKDEEYKNNFLSNMNNGVEGEGLSDNDKKLLAKDKIAKEIAILYYIYYNIQTLVFDINRNENELKKLLKNQTQKEYDLIKNFFDNITNKYKSSLEKTDSVYSFFDEITWNTPSELYIDNKKYTHYLFKDSLSNIPYNKEGIPNDESSSNENKNKISEEDGNNQLSTKTKYEPNSYMYWLKYCGMATLMNCALPMYWGTGLLIAGAPMPLPIILIPIYVYNGSCIQVLCLGICGLAIYPTILFSNLSTNIMSYLTPINIVIDLIHNGLKEAKKNSKTNIKNMLKAHILSLDKQIKNTEMEIEGMKKEIQMIKSM